MKMKWLIGAVVLVAAALGVYAWQLGTPQNESGAAVVDAPAVPLPEPTAPAFKDTSMLRAPAGAKVAIFEFDDLECPACAHALPILHEAAQHYAIPLVHHDYPLTEIHVWSFDAAVTARYLEDKVSPAVADQFRRGIFAHQTEISSKDDLAKFTTQWFQAHGQTMPFIMDADGKCRDEVKADRALGDRIGVSSTPCIFVVTQQGWKQVKDVSNLSATIEEALAMTKA